MKQSIEGFFRLIEILHKGGQRGDRIWKLHFSRNALPLSSIRSIHMPSGAGRCAPEQATDTRLDLRLEIRSTLPSSGERGFDPLGLRPTGAR